jgi:hypothetical protein
MKRHGPAHALLALALVAYPLVATPFFTVQVGAQGGTLDSLHIFDAFDVALVRMLVGGADGDDALGTGHL